MSLKTIKTILETYLEANVTTKAIKWANTTVYTLNSVVLSSAQVTALDEFLEPMIIPITEDREIFGSTAPFNYEVFFQISIHTRLNTGESVLFDTINTLNLLFKETTISGLVCDKSETLKGVQVGDYIATPVRFKCHLFAV